MLETILLALAPLVVSGLTSVLKRIQGIAQSGYKNTIVRFIAVALSFGGVVAISATTGSEVDVISIGSFVETFLVFLAATGAWFFGKKAV